MFFEKGEEKRLRVTVEVNHPVKLTPDLRIGEADIVLHKEGSIQSSNSQQSGPSDHFFAAKFTGVAWLSDLGDIFEPLVAGQTVVQVPLQVDGIDSWAVRFDADPSTAPILTTGANGALTIKHWEGKKRKRGPGGSDRLSGHELPIHSIDPAAYLASIEARQNNAVIYQADWQTDPTREGARLHQIGTNEPYDPDLSMDVALSFSKPVKSVELGLGSGQRGEFLTGFQATLPGPGQDAKTDYSLTIPVTDKVKSDLTENGELTFFVSARTESGLELDADPRSPAKYDWDDKRYYGLEQSKDYDGDTSKGGTDTWHKLNASGQSVAMLLDASGSMADHGRMTENKAGLSAALQSLKPNDEVALIVFFDCDDIRVMVPFTNDPAEIIKVLQTITPSAGTPLGDAMEFAKAYAKRNARYQNPQIMTFSDGQTSCGKSAAGVVQEMKDDSEGKPEQPEEQVKELEWSVFRVGGDAGPAIPKYWVEEVEYHERQADQSRARLTVRRYPVSWMSSGGRTLWSINWSRPKVVTQRMAKNADIERLRADAEALRASGVAKAAVHEALQSLIGPQAEPLRRG